MERDDLSDCTTETCDPALGCQYTPAIDCDDDDDCTQDHCYATLGCTHVRAPTAEYGGLNGCADCPTWAGFACVSDVLMTWCENAETRAIWVPAGTFLFGCNSDKLQCAFPGSPPPNRAKLYVDGFAIGKFEMTADEWAAVGIGSPLIGHPSPEDATMSYV